jgi:hypothetical protein
MELKHKLKLSWPLFLAVILAGAAQAAEVYRWVDENGEVHYSETLPPDHQDKGHDVLNERGIVLDEDQQLTPPPPEEKPVEEERQELPRDASGLPRAKAMYSENELQARMDNFLMLRYDNEQEIADAMNVEIKQLSYDRRLLETSNASMSESYRGQIRIAAEKQRAGQQVSQETVEELDNLQTRLAANAVSLAGLQAREDSIRAEFQKQLDRYRYLVEQNTEDSSGY